MSDRRVPTHKTAGTVPLAGKKAVWKGGTLLSPVPAVIVTCAEGDAVNALTVAWTGIVCSQPPMTYISLRPERFSYGVIRRTGEFTINLPSASLVRELDLCGVKSGRESNKIDLCGFTLQPAETVRSPLIAQAPIALECKVTQVIPLGSHDLFLARITAVRPDQSLIDEAGKLRTERAGLLAYSHGTYYTLGKSLGTFGFSVRKKKRRAGTRKKKGE